MAFDGSAFGRRLASAREWRGLDPKEVAVQLGRSAEAINRWERGGLQKPPGKGDLRLLAELLDKSEEWLLRGPEPPWDAPADSLAARLERIEGLATGIAADVAELRRRQDGGV